MKWRMFAHPADKKKIITEAIVQIILAGKKNLLKK